MSPAQMMKTRQSIVFIEACGKGLRGVYDFAHEDGGGQGHIHTFCGCLFNDAVLDHNARATNCLTIITQ